MYTAINYEERVAIWRQLMRLSTFTPKAFSRTGQRLLKDLKECGYIDVTPEGSRIARGTACMPKEVDPAHWWQRAAWCVLRWYPAGVSLDHLHMLTEPSTGVTTAELRAWLKLCILTGVVQMNWRRERRHQRKYYRCLHMNDPEPPHRFELIRRLKKQDLQVEVEFAGYTAETAKGKQLLLQLVEELGSVSQACHIMGYDRDTFYNVRRALKAGGATPVEKKRAPKGPPPNRWAAEIEQQILALCLEWPTWGAKRIAGELRLRGVNVSHSGVHGFWLRHNLTRIHQRLLRLETEAQKETVTLSDEQVRLLVGLRQGSIPRRCPPSICSEGPCCPSMKPS